MTSKPFNNIVSALLSMRTALTTHVNPSLRAVTVNLDMENELYICHFFTMVLSMNINLIWQVALRVKPLIVGFVTATFYD